MSSSWVAPFLLNLKRTGNVSKSSALAGVSSSTPYDLKRRDADFAAAFDQAIEDHVDTCEEELTRRAFGYEEPVVYQGQLSPVWERDEQGQVVLEVYNAEGNTRPRQAIDENGQPKWLTVTKFSDTLLLAKVKAYRKRYSTERTELTGPDGSAVEIDATTRAARVAAMMALAKQRKAAVDAAEPLPGADDFGDLA